MDQDWQRWQGLEAREGGREEEGERERECPSALSFSLVYAPAHVRADTPALACSCVRAQLFYSLRRNPGILKRKCEMTESLKASEKQVCCTGVLQHNCARKGVLMSKEMFAKIH